MVLLYGDDDDDFITRVYIFAMCTVNVCWNTF